MPPPPPGLGGAPLSRLIIGGLNGGSPTNGAASPGSAHSAHSAASAAAVAAAAASNDPTAAARRRLPNRPQMPIFPQGTVYIYLDSNLINSTFCLVTLFFYNIES